MITKEQYAKAIEMYEMNKNGFNRLNGVSVQAKSIRIRKSKIVANIKIFYDEEQIKEFHNNCEYSIELLGRCIANLDIATR
jgi:hypothetical protein